MTIDVSTISAQAKARYIETGKHFSSEDTLAQGDATIGALNMHGTALEAYGFGPKDQAKLVDARDALLAAGVVRKSAQAGATQQRTTKAKAVRDGKTDRAGARSVLIGARRDLHESCAPEAAAAVATIDACLAKTSSSGGSQAELGKQLSLLRETLENPVIAAATADRGGPAAVAGLTSAIQKVEGTTATPKRGTPEQTERLDLFDGIICELTRAARKAARVAARKAGTPALAHAFALTHLDAQAVAAPLPVEPPPAPATPPVIK
jgi:hypothetical protein